MIIPFHKYQGTGNDFVLIDQRQTQYLTRTDTKKIQHLCDRRFGIGADGLILLQNHPDHDFEMIYFNADGNESTLCGNGGRCIVAFANYLNIINQKASFLAIDGTHQATIKGRDYVSLRMLDVPDFEQGEDYFIIDTGSPHYVIFVEDLDDIDIVENGKAIRYSKRFKKEGINVNFVEKQKDNLLVATYERGVEDETLSCGTGVTAAAIACQALYDTPASGEIAIRSKGGQLSVKLSKDKNGGARNIWLQGKATRVFEGIIELKQ